MRHTNASLTKLLPALGLLILNGCGEFPYSPEQWNTPIRKPVLPYVVSKDSLRHFLATSNVKVVYLEGVGKKRTAVLVDFSSSDSVTPPNRLHMPIEQDANLNYPADAPKISPDGKWVAYYLTDGSSNITFVQSLDTASRPSLFAQDAAQPHWWKARDGSLYIVYCKESSGDVALEDTAVGYTKRQQVDPNDPRVKIGNPVTIVKGESFNGGITNDGRYLFTGDYRSYVHDTLSGTTIPINFGIQTCNASTSPDTGSAGYRFMFLNIGGVQNLTNDKTTSYEQHEVIFIVGLDNAVVHAIDKHQVFAEPRGEWQDPEWSNSPDYFIALSDNPARSTSGTSFDCYLVRIANQPVVLQFNNASYLGMQGDASPDLWIGK